MRNKGPTCKCDYPGANLNNDPLCSAKYTDKQNIEILIEMLCETTVSRRQKHAISAAIRSLKEVKAAAWTTITLTTDMMHVPLSREKARQMIKDAGTKPQRRYHSPLDPHWAFGYYWVVADGVIEVMRHRGHK